MPLGKLLRNSLSSAVCFEAKVVRMSSHDGGEWGFVAAARSDSCCDDRDVMPCFWMFWNRAWSGFFVSSRAVLDKEFAYIAVDGGANADTDLVVNASEYRRKPTDFIVATFTVLSN